MVDGYSWIITARFGLFGALKLILCFHQEYKFTINLLKSKVALRLAMSLIQIYLEVCLL